MNIGFGLRDDTVADYDAYGCALIDYHPEMLYTWLPDMGLRYFRRWPWWYSMVAVNRLEALKAQARGAVSFDAVAYNFETRRSSDQESDNPIDAARVAAHVAHFYHREFLMIPGMRMMLAHPEYYGPMAAVADRWVIQTQGFQRWNVPGAEYAAVVREHMALVRAGNPDIPIWLQISVTPHHRLIDAATWMAYANSVPEADGYAIWDGNDLPPGQWYPPPPRGSGLEGTRPKTLADILKLIRPSWWLAVP
jgi:hypothetical protein